MNGHWLSRALRPAEIAHAAETACLLEVAAPKPGNVNRQADFCDVSYEDFVLSARAIGPAMSRASSDGVGQIIWQATAATHRVVGSNTNLGMILLLAPLAKACTHGGALRASLVQVLRDLTVEDAQRAYTAIRLVRPGGLGRAPQGDVSEEPAITLGEAMALAQERDSIAREYVTDFAITFEVACPALSASWPSIAEPEQAIVQAYLMVLAEVPDTLIARKRSPATARAVTRKAAEVLARGGVRTESGRHALREFDHSLRDAHHSLNPGTTADLIAAAIFVHLVTAAPDQPRLDRPGIVSVPGVAWSPS